MDGHLAPQLPEVANRRNSRCRSASVLDKRHMKPEMHIIEQAMHSACRCSINRMGARGSHRGIPFIEHPHPTVRH